MENIKLHLIIWGYIATLISGMFIGRFIEYRDNKKSFLNNKEDIDYWINAYYELKDKK